MRWVCNVAEAWLRESYQGREEEWNRSWADLFDPDPRKAEDAAVPIPESGISFD